MRPRYSRTRDEFIEESEKLWLNRISRAERDLARLVARNFLPRLERSNGRIQTTTSNFNALNTLNELWDRFTRTESVKLATYFVERTLRLFDINERYFSGVADVGADDFRRIMSESKRQIYLGLGYDLENERVIANGPIDRIFSDERPINEIKREASNAITGNVETAEAETAIINRVRGVDDRPGSLGSFLGESMPQPFQTFDRRTTTVVADGLNIRYFIYQGGTIRDSRPFCVVRDGRVFTSEEIARFGTASDAYGGYTNKGNGEFAGKCPKFGYNPFRDLGGCNCRHSLDAISEQLAFNLRPELRENSNP